MDVKKKVLQLAALNQNVIRVFICLVPRNPSVTLKVVLYSGVEFMRLITIRRVIKIQSIYMWILIYHVDRYLRKCIQL